MCGKRRDERAKQGPQLHADAEHEDKHSQLIGKGAGILNRVTIDTPATQPGSHYALIPARMLLALSGGELLVLAVLLSQRRSNGTFLRALTLRRAGPVHRLLRGEH